MKIFGTEIKLTDYDRTLGLVICFVTVLGLMTSLILHLSFGIYFADELAIVFSSFWTGATITWLIEKFLLHREK